jgi:CzcA family heavy metal efflux pump
MMQWIVGSSLRIKRTVIAAAAVIFAVGVWQLRDVSTDTLPEFKPPIVEVQTEALGLSAEEIEQLITVPLEQDLLNGVAFLDTIRSQSVPGLSHIEMVFEPGTDLYTARQVVQERLNEAHALPNVSRVPAMLQPLSSTSRALMISLSSDELTPIQMGVLARWNIVPRLTGVPGVANVVIWGQKERQLQVLVDPERLADNEVTLAQVISTTGNALWASPLSFLEASTPGTGGFIDNTNQRLGVQHISPIKTADQLAQVVIEPPEGRTSAARATPLRLGDVAEVVEDHQPLIGEALVHGGEGLLLVVEKFPDANTAAVTEGVEDALDSMRPGLSGLNLDTGVFRPATYVEHAGNNFKRSAIIGGALALIALGGLLFSWRRALISLVAVAFSLVAAGLVLYLRESTFNAIVVAGLVMALSALIDDAVVNVENVGRRLQHGGSGGLTDDRDGSSTGKVVLTATLESAHTFAYSAVIMIVALVPVFFLESLAGDSFYPPLAISFIVAMLVSLLVALTVTPALCLLLLPKEPARESPVVRRLQGLYDQVLAPVLRRTGVAVVGALAIVILGALALPRLDRAVLPDLKETNLLVQWNGAPGTSLTEMERITSRATEELRRIDGVRDVGAHVGRAITGDQVGGANNGELWVSLAPEADYDATVAAVEAVVGGYPGIERNVLTYSKKRIASVLPGAERPVVVRIYGQNLGTLREKADEVSAILSRVEGATDVTIESQAVEPTIEIEVDLGAAQEAGIKPGDVRRAATTLVSGIQVGSLFEEQKVFDVQVWGTPEVRGSTSDIEGLLLDLPDGGHVRLGDVADVRIGSSPTSIRHYATSRSLDVSANVDGRRAGAVVGDLKDRLRDVAFPLEYHAEVLGDYQDRRSAERRLGAFAAAAALGIFLLFQAAFGSWRLAVVAFLSLPVSLSGGLAAAWIDGGTITLASVAGLLAVLTLAVRQGLRLIDHFQRLERDEGVEFGPGLVRRGAREGLGPIVTTAATTIAALIPFVVFGSIAGQEIVKPMVVVVIGGLISSTLVTLFVLPSLYLRFAVPLGRAENVSVAEHLEAAPAGVARGT